MEDTKVDPLLQEGQSKMQTQHWTGFSHVEVTGILGKNSLVGAVVSQTRLNRIDGNWEESKYQAPPVLLERKEQKQQEKLRDGMQKNCDY